MSTRLERKDQKIENTWALEDMFPSDEAWQQAFDKAKEYLPRIRAMEGHVGESGENLLAMMQLDDELNLAVMDLAEYACRRADEDTRVSKYQDMVARLMAFITQLNTAASFETNEVLAIPADTLEAYYQQVPGLELYRLKLSRLLRQKEHVLSPAEEMLLAAAGEISGTPENIFSMLNDADMTFPNAVDSEGVEHTVTHGSYVPLLYSPDRALRKSAFEQLYSVYDQFKNTSAAILSAQTKQLLFHAKARKYPSSLAASLENAEVPVEVYHNLISAVHENLPKLHRYTALRKKLLGVDELHFYDLYTPLVSDVKMEISFEEAKELIQKALKPLGEEYLAILKKGLESRWIDVYENVGKRSGAYSAGSKIHPYVLLNYQGTLNDVFTLIHEMGHALHSYLSNEKQPAVYSEYVLFVAEVASTCNESLLMQYLLSQTTDRKQRAYLINYFLEQFRGTLFRQTMFAEFELKINELAQQGVGLTAETLNELYLQINRDYFGEAIELDPQIALEWGRIPHFFYDFYVYQYATGYSAAIALSQRILKEGESAVKDYLDFLSGGCSADPITLLRGAGVDMATPAPVNQALVLFDELLDQMEELMAEE